MTPAIALIAALSILLPANITATIVVLRSSAATRSQKALQLLLVWLIPLLGAAIVITFHWLDRRNPGRQPKQALHEVDINLLTGAGHVD